MKSNCKSFDFGKIGNNTDHNSCDDDCDGCHNNSDSNDHFAHCCFDNDHADFDDGDCDAYNDDDDKNVGCCY